MNMELSRPKNKDKRNDISNSNNTIEQAHYMKLEAAEPNTFSVRFLATDVRLLFVAARSHYRWPHSLITQIPLFSKVLFQCYLCATEVKRALLVHCSEIMTADSFRKRSSCYN